jgi:hypothetical protein
MKREIKKIKNKFFFVLLAIIAVFISIPVHTYAVSPEMYPTDDVYVIRAGVKNPGTPTSENSLATALAYRSNRVGQSMYSISPPPTFIFPAGSGLAAYTAWDVSGIWSTNPKAVGDDVYLVYEARAGKNGWAGNSYVAGTHAILTQSDLNNISVYPPDAVMEPIPTPVVLSNTQTSLTFQFNALSDRTDVAPLGVWSNSIVGYTLYRSANTTASPVAIGTIAQPANGIGTITYVDSTVTQGVPYFYQLAVNFRWTANTPNPWYETIAKGPWSASMSSGLPSDAVKFMTAAVSSTSTIKAGPVTISAYNFATGNVGTTTLPVTMNLTSNSTGVSSFYTYAAGICTLTSITSITIPAGQSTVSFCYGDTKVGTWTITATPTNTWNAISQAGQNITVGPLDHFSLAFTSPQINNTGWTGVNTVTAQDIGGNIISNFSSQGINANLSVSNGGILVNNTLLSASFVNGVANVTAQNFKYTGSSGVVNFTVTSSNGKSGSTAVTITPGSIISISLRDGVAGGGTVVGARSLTVDNTLTIYASGYDISGNYISNVSGAWVADGTLQSSFISPGASIIFAPSLAGSSGTISFSDGAGHNAQTGIINVSYGALASFSLPNTIAAQNAGILFDIGPITAFDAKGNIVKSFSATVTIGDNTGSVTPATSSVFVNGQLNSQMIKVTKASGGVVVTATDTASSKTGVTNSFSVAHGPLHHFVLNFASPQVNDLTWTGVNTLTAQDQWNNIITDYDITGSAVSLSVSNGAILENNNLVAGDFSAGIANLTLKNFKYTGIKGSIIFTAASSGKTGAATVVISSGSVNSVSIKNGANNTGSVVTTHDMQVGDSFVMYAAGYDISNNYITDIGGTWSRTGTLDAPPGGIISSLNYQPITAYTSGTITFNDGVGHTGETGTIHVDRGPIDHFVLSFATPQVVGVSFSGVNTLTAKDIGGNTITDYNTVGTQVKITTVSPGATLLNNIFPASNFSSGVVDLNTRNFTYTGPSGNISFLATSVGTLKTGTTSTILNAGSLDHFDFNLSPIQLINAAFTGINTLTALDIGGNTITNFNPLVDNVAITYSPSVLGENTVTGLEGPKNNILSGSGDFVNGVANLTGRLTHPGPGGGYTFVATSVSGKTGSSAGVDVDVGPLHHFGFDIIGNQIAGQPFSVKIKAYAQDPQGINHIKVSYVGAVILTDGSGTALPVSIGPFVNGEAVANITVTKTTVGNILHVKDATVQTITGDSNAFDVKGGSLNHFTFIGTIGNQAAGTEFDTGRIEARDAFDNIAETFENTADIIDATGSVLPGKTEAFTAGVLAGQNLVITKAKTADFLTISSGGNQGMSNSFNVNAGPVTTVAISDQAGGASGAVGARTISTDDTLLLYAVGYDVYDNYTGAVVGSWDATGNLDAPSASSNANILYAPLRAPLSGTITFDDKAGHTAETGIISVKHGALARFNLSTQASNQVGVILAGPAKLTALDSKDNIVSDFNASVDNISFVASTGGNILGLGTNKNNIINTGPSFINGVADLNDLSFVYAGVAGNVTLTATSSSGKSGASTVNFIVGPLDHFNLLLNSIQKNAIPFSGSNKIEAVDLGNNVLTDFNAGSNMLHVTVSPSDGVLSGLSDGNILGGAGDFVNGVADISNKFIFTGNKGPHIFTATSISGKKGVSSSIEILPGDLFSIEIRNAGEGQGGIVGNQTLKAGDIFTVWAAGYDASHNLIQDQTVSWTGTGAVDTLLNPVNGSSTAFTAMTPGTGVIYANVGNITAKTGTITVDAGAVTKVVFLNYPYDGNYKIIPPPPHSNNAPVITGKSSGPIILQAEDVVGNVVMVKSRTQFDMSTTGNGTFSSDNTSWSPFTSFSISSGESSATIYYQDSNSGTYNISVAPQDSGISGDSQPLVVIPVYDLSLVFTTPPTTVKAGVVSGPITIELEDATGAPAISTDDIAVTLSSNSPGNKKFFFDGGGVAEIQGFNIPAGQSSVTVYYKDTAVTQSLISAISPNITTGYEMVTVNAGDPARLFITPGSALSDGQNIIQNYSSGKITVQIFDSMNNLVPMTSNTKLHLSSSSSTGNFISNDTNGAWVDSSQNPTLTIKSGESEGHFYYRDNTLGQVTLTASSQPEHNWINATQMETIYAPVISKFAFITPIRAIDTNASSQIITVQTQDITGNAIAVSSDTPVSLITSNPSGGSFSNSSSGPWNVNTLVIPVGQSSFNFYYKDTTPGTKTIGISETPSLGWADATQQITINAGAVAKLAFASINQSIARNIASGAIIVELEDTNGYPTVYATDLAVSISTDSATGAFSTNSTVGPWNVSSVVIPAGQSTAVFYYRDQQAGSFTLNAHVGGQTWNATQTISVTEGVIGQIVFTSALQSIALNTSSSVINIETEDVQGNAVDVAADTSITLGSNSTAPQFSADGTNWGVTSVIISAGTHKTSFYYKDSTAGTFSLSASESPSKGWIDGGQQIVVGSIENTISKLKFKTAPEVGSAAVSGGEVSGKITVETESSFGNAVNVTQVTYLVINSSNMSGRFSNSPAGPFTGSIVLTLLPGKSSADFYYMDTIQGIATLTVSEFPSIGWTDDTQPIEIKSGAISQIAFTTPAQTLFTDSYSGIITIETRDVYGNASTVNGDTVINLASTSGTGTFYPDTNPNSSPITSVTILANHSNTSFYYKNSTQGTFTISADAGPSNNWVPASQSITLGDLQLSSLVIQPDYSLLPTNTSVQMTAIGYNALGNPIPNLRIDWGISNPAAGSITNDGVLTTGDNIGKYAAVVTATASGVVAKSSFLKYFKVAEAAGTVTASATVEIYKAPTTIVVTPPPPTTSSGGGGGSSFFVPQPPSNLMIFINDGEPETLSRDVTLSLYATNASYTKISEFKDFHDVSKWSTYDSSAKFTLSNGYGKKTVYVKYKNASGDESAVTNAVTYYVTKATTTTTVPTTNVVNEIIKKYNYVIVNAASPGSAPVLPIVISPVPNSHVIENQVTVTGSALPNTVVTLHVHSAKEVIVKAVTDSNGAFVYNFDANELAAGDHEIYASIDETGGSLVGPAVAFNVVPAVTGAVVSSGGFSFNGSLWFFLVLWIIIIGIIIIVFYRALTGNGFSLNLFMEVIVDITDINWWMSLPRKFISLCRNIWKRISNKS